MSTPLLEEFPTIEAVGAVFLDIDQKFRDADFTEPLTKFQDDIEQAESQNWQGRHTPVKTQWPKLAASTIRRKGHDQPLVLTGALRASMTDRNAPHHVGEVLPMGLTFGTDLPYAGFHQDGTDRIPQREFSGLDDDLVQKAVDAVTDHLVDSLMYTTRG